MGNEAQPQPPENKLGRGRPASETMAHKVRGWLATGLWGGMGIFTVGSLITFMVMGGESAPDMIGGETDTTPQDPDSDLVKERDEEGPTQETGGSHEVTDKVNEIRAKGGYWSQFAPSTPSDTSLNLEQLTKYATETGCYGTYEGVKYQVWESKTYPGLYHYIPVQG